LSRRPAVDENNASPIDDYNIAAIMNVYYYIMDCKLLMNPASSS
jgi:hypothetical protein